MRKVRSSRALEEAAYERLDFMWLLEGHRPDHSTFAGFRTKHTEALKDLNRQISERIFASNEGALVALIIDGTRLRADSNRHGARTGKALEKMIAACQEELNVRLKLLEAGDAALESASVVQQQTLVEHLTQQETPVDATELDEEVKALRTRLAQLEKARKTAEERDEVKRRGNGKKLTPTRVPVTDPDSQLTPNKEGGYAPNYTPILAVDAATGAIVQGEVPEGSSEAGAVLPAVKAARELGGTPERVLADSGFASNDNFAELESQGIQSIMPTGLDARPQNPVNRSDLQTPVAEEKKDDIPKAHSKFSQAAFIYDEKQDGYYCPRGEFLAKTGYCQGGNERAGYTTYRCSNQGACPWVQDCTKSQSGQRVIKRADGQAEYKKRAPVVEGAFGIIKHALGIRRFHLRGLEKVRTEWSWICGAFNLKKLLKQLAGSGKKGQPGRNTSPNSPVATPIQTQIHPSRAPMYLAA